MKKIISEALAKLLCMAAILVTFVAVTIVTYD